MWGIDGIVGIYKLSCWRWVGQNGAGAGWGGWWEAAAAGVAGPRQVRLGSSKRLVGMWGVGRLD